MAVCTVDLSQFVGCYSENPGCTSGDNTCRVVDYVSGMAEAKHELGECAAACRLTNSVYFAKTVSMSKHVYRLLRPERHNEARLMQY